MIPHTKVVKLCELGNLNRLKKVLKKANNAYHNLGQPILSDKSFDYLKECITIKDPHYTFPIGAPIQRLDDRVVLPYHMGSIDKITEKTPRALQIWIRKNPAEKYLVSEKLDGISALLVVKDGVQKLYTRGDGTKGSDITFLTKVLPAQFPSSKNITVRGELIISKEAFEKKYSNRYKNARNMVAGIVGSKSFSEGLIDIKFIAYEIVENYRKYSEPSKQLSVIKSYGFNTPLAYLILFEKLNIPYLEAVFKKIKLESKYNIDGIVVQPNTRYVRNTKDNPSYMFAYKVLELENVKDTIVKDVVWNLSRRGYLIPVAIIEPVNILGVTINRVTVNNAKMLSDKKIGPGAIVSVTRSNDVIPLIVEVKRPSTNMKFPSIKFRWDSNFTHFVAERSKEADDEKCIKMISFFFSDLDIKHVGEQTIRKLYNAGFDNLYKIITIDKDDILKIQGFKEKSSKRIVDSIRNTLRKKSLLDLLSASGVLGAGIGKRKIKKLFDELPNFLLLRDEFEDNEIFEAIINIEGFSDTTALLLLENLENAKKFSILFADFVGKRESLDSKDQTLSGVTIVFSGFRDKELKEIIESLGGKINTSVSKNTDLVVVKDLDSKSSKLQKAEKLGIEIVEKELFLENFL